MQHLSITRLKLRRFWHMPRFLIAANRSVVQMRAAEGFVTGYVASERPIAFWTVSIWRDEAAKNAFYRTGAHRDVMPRLLDWCEEASVAADDYDELELPSPTEAAEIMLAKGRLSKVRHPSRAQERGIIWPSRKTPSSAGGAIKPAGEEGDPR